MPTIEPQQVEAEARAILRERIERSGWFPGLPEDERRRLVEQDVEHHWPLMIPDAAKRLVDRFEPS